MRARQAAYLVAAAFLAFAAWEAVQHVWFMDLPVAAYHMISLIVDLILVLLITLIALAIVRARAQPEAHERAAQDAVVSALAQDLRPHLLSTLTMLRALQSAPHEEVSEETRALLRQTEARAAVFLEMIEHLVSMAERLDKPGPQCASVSLAQLAEQAFEAYRPVAEARAVKLEAHVQPGMIQTCAAPDAVLRALSGLLERSLQTTPRGGRVELRASCEESTRLVVLSVSDTAEPLLDRSASIDEVIAKHGLIELRYVQQLAVALGASVRYEPGPGGNTIAFSLPARETAQ